MRWNDLLLFLFLFGGLAVGALTTLGLLLPPARRYYGRWTLVVAAALPTLAFAGGGLGFFVILIVATAASFLLIFPPLLRPAGNPSLKRPILPALAIFAADAWNTFILLLAADPAFMGGQC